MRDIMLIVHFIGVAMFLGTGFAYMILEIANSKLEKDERRNFSLRILPLSKMGHIGLALLIISGGYLMSPYWQILPNLPWLIVKLCLVALLTIVISIMAVYSRKAKKGDTERYLKKIEPYSTVAFILGLAIVIIAAVVFH